MKKKAYLILENRIIFEGISLGSTDTTIGEVVFTTGMSGYIESLTDKSYYGQIITSTFPLIGNYGTIHEDFEAPAISAVGYIVRHWCEEPSNFRNEGDLDTFLKKQNVTGIAEIDTRKLTKILRENGTMNGMITTDLKNMNIDAIRHYQIHNAPAHVSGTVCREVHAYGKRRIVLLDFGYKENIVRELVKRDAHVYIIPYHSGLQDILALHPDGIMLSNGPGDPEDNQEVITMLKELVNENIPIFGICLGHQLLALAHNFRSQKLKFGHRGNNQSVRDMRCTNVFVTSQNHGYAIDNDSIDLEVAELSFVNVNDQTCEGIHYKHHPIFSVQFHPEGCAGPQDTNFLFDEFMQEVETYAKKSCN